MTIPGLMPAGWQRAGWRTTFDIALTLDTPSSGTTNYRYLIPSSVRTVKSAAKMRFTLDGPSTGSYGIVAARVGIAETPGSIANFTVGTPLVLTVKGMLGYYTLFAGERIVSDPINLTIADGQDLIIAWMTPLGGYTLRYVSTGPAGMAGAWKSSAVDETFGPATGTWNSLTNWALFSKVEFFQ